MRWQFAILLCHLLLSPPIGVYTHVCFLAISHWQKHRTAHLDLRIIASGRRSPVATIQVLPGKPYGFSFSTEPVFGSFFPCGPFCCWPVAVFGRMQPVFFQQIVDKKP